MASKNDKLIPYDETSITVTDKIRKAITKKHKDVSSLNTPKPFIKKKMGMEYVEFSYMREVVDQEYPGWSWTIERTEVLGSDAYVVHGRLKWFDEGIWRLGDMCAAHRIQKKRGTNEFVDIGNDVKASNTDCIKKAFNFYLNICDDVYRNQVDDLTLSDEQKDKIIEVAGMSGDERRIEIVNLINEQVIHSANYNSSFAKLEREAGI